MAPTHDDASVRVTSKSAEPKRSIACNFCRAKKIRCNGGTPCANCRDHGEECVSASKRRTRLKGKSAIVLADGATTAQRLARLEALLEAAEPGSSSLPPFSASFHQVDSQGSRTEQMVSNPELSFGQSTPLPCNAMPPSLNPRGGNNSALDRNTRSPPRTNTTVFPTAGGEDRRPVSTPDCSCLNGMSSGLCPDFASSSPLATPLMMTQSPESSLTRPLSRFDPEKAQPMYHTNQLHTPRTASDEKQDVSSVYNGETSNWEYHGPRSYLSICSKPGIQWVGERTGSPHFQEAASSLTSGITRRLKIERKLSKERTPEPEPAVAWKYVQAHFDGSSDAAFGIVDRNWFESRLRSQICYPTTEEDPAWYALRNAIYASGCRLYLAKRQTFSEAYRTAWGYFENALAVHTELLYFRTSLLAVQALTVMAYYTEGLGSPCLEYMLCANASRLAYSKGLQRQPVSSWNLSPSEECHRNWLFWAIYCLEKNCASYSGRPSMINDLDTSCQLPRNPPPGASVNIEYAIILIRLAQMMSLVAEKSSDIDRFALSPEALASTAAGLDAQHVELGAFLGDLVSFDVPLDCVELPANMNLQQATYIRLTYFIIGMDVHTALTCPWSQLRKHPALLSQVQKSADSIAKTARAAILATHFIRIDASTPVLLAFFAPMYSLINLFIHILQHPDISTVPSDLALMDIGAAHFARLEFATDSVIPITFAKEIASLARTAVKYQQTLSSRPTGTLYPYGERLGAIQDGRGMEATGDNETEETPNAAREGQTMNFIDLELDHWSTFLPLHDFDGPFNFGVP